MRTSHAATLESDTDNLTPTGAPEPALAERARLEGLETELADQLAELLRLFSPDGPSRQLLEARSELTAQQADLDQQRQRLAHTLRLADQQQAELDAQRLRLRAQRRRVGASLKQQRAELRQQLQQFHTALTSHTGASTAAADVTDQVAALTHQRDDLLARVAAAETAGQSAVNEDAKAAHDKTYELQRRFEMAVEDMRAYKHRVVELEEQLAARPESVAKGVADGPLDWAAQKAIMLASLASDMAGADQQDDRLTVEGAVRITDEVVADRDREIAQLKRQMEDLRTERVAATVHDAGVAEVLDHDALIASERERLRKLQESVLEKQRNSEVDLAVERAKLARQRTEIEDRMHALESELARRPEGGIPSMAGSTAPAAQGKATRGRWLARLGLKDE